MSRYGSGLDSPRGAPLGPQDESPSAVRRDINWKARISNIYASSSVEVYKNQYRPEKRMPTNPTGSKKSVNSPLQSRRHAGASKSSPNQNKVRSPSPKKAISPSNPHSPSAKKEEVSYIPALSVENSPKLKEEILMEGGKLLYSGGNSPNPLTGQEVEKIKVGTELTGKALELYEREMSLHGICDLGAKGPSRTEFRAQCREALVEVSKLGARRGSGQSEASHCSAGGAVESGRHSANSKHSMNHIRVLEAERNAVSRLGFIDKANALDQEIRMLRAEAEVEAEREMRALFEQEERILMGRYEMRQGDLEKNLGKEMEALLAKQEVEFQKLKNRHRTTFVSQLESTERRVVGKASKCNCKSWYSCRHNKSASYNTRKPSPTVIQYRRNAEKMRHHGRNEDALNWDRKAKELDAHEQEEWTKKLSQQLVTAPWGANESNIDSIIRKHKQEVEEFASRKQHEVELLEMRQNKSRYSLDSWKRAEIGRIQKRVKKIYADYQRAEENGQAMQMDRYATDVYGDNDETGSGLGLLPYVEVESGEDVEYLPDDFESLEVPEYPLRGDMDVGRKDDDVLVPEPAIERSHPHHHHDGAGKQIPQYTDDDEYFASLDDNDRTVTPQSRPCSSANEVRKIEKEKERKREQERVTKAEAEAEAEAMREAARQEAAARKKAQEEEAEEARRQAEKEKEREQARAAAEAKKRADKEEAQFRAQAEAEAKAQAEIMKLQARIAEVEDEERLAQEEQQKEDELRAEKTRRGAVDATYLTGSVPQPDAPAPTGAGAGNVISAELGNEPQENEDGTVDIRVIKRRSKSRNRQRRDGEEDSEADGEHSLSSRPGSKHHKNKHHRKDKDKDGGDDAASVESRLRKKEKKERRRREREEREGVTEWIPQPGPGEGG